MYWLSLISSITGIISFLLPFFDKFQKWKVYLLPFSFLMIGITIGIIMSMAEDTVQQFTQAQVIYLIAFVLIISLLVLFVYRYLNNSNDPFLFSLLIMGGMSYVAINLLNTVESSQSTIKDHDYVILSNYYKNHEQYAQAADYLKKYKALQKMRFSNAFLDSIDRAIDDLYQKDIEQIRK